MQNTDLEYYIIKCKKILDYCKEITKHHAQYAKQHALPHPEQKQGHPSDPKTSLKPKQERADCWINLLAKLYFV